MDLDFSVNEQILTRQTEVCLANHTNNYLNLNFNFNETWEGYDHKYILYHFQDKVYQQILEYDQEEDVYTTIVPRSALIGLGFNFSLYGTRRVEDAPDDRITTNLYKIKLLESGFTIDIDPTSYDYDEDIFDHYENLFLAFLSTKADVVHTHESSDVQDLEQSIGADVKRGLLAIADSIRRS